MVLSASTRNRAWPKYLHGHTGQRRWLNGRLAWNQIVAQNPPAQGRVGFPMQTAEATNVPELRYMNKQVAGLQLIRRQPVELDVSTSPRPLNLELPGIERPK
jgi:hypothetical protein